MQDLLRNLDAIIIGITDDTLWDMTRPTGSPTELPSAPMAERVGSGARRRICKQGHDLSKPESRAGVRSRECKICKRKRDKGYKDTPSRKRYKKKYERSPKRVYYKYKNALKHRIAEKYIQLKELEDQLHAEEVIS